MSNSEIDVWLDVGRTGRCFTYQDGKELGVGVGDIVLVHLRGRLMHGLVVGINKTQQISRKGFQQEKTILSLTNIDSVLQKAAVEKIWKDWIEAVAKKCYVSSFRMLKAALPPGWLGQVKYRSTEGRSLWWISLSDSELLLADLSSRQKTLQTFLFQKGGGAWQKDLLSNGFSSGFLKSCLALGFVERYKKMGSTENVVIKKTTPFLIPKLDSLPSLTDEQKEALKIYEKLSPGSSLLLWGITGSGKTEVYLQMAAKELLRGKHCLILAPEIGLIPQLVDRCRKRFGPSIVFEYHSGCSQKQRIQSWRDSLNAMDPIVIVGTRSAVFLPLSPLGLIVLDEEHDSSYKQESPMPCYHARELAIHRGEMTGAKIVLGSATPSLTTWKNLTPRGSIALARLSRRISNQALPSVVVVDMRQELADGHRKLLSRPLIDHLSSLHESKEQAVILVPRRGYSSFLSCRSCGDVVQCPNCDVSLTVHQSHRSHQWLRCHWCDYRASIGFKCKECGSTAFKPFGAGTQRVMEKLEQELTNLRILRFDRDTTRGRDGHRRVLTKFAAGEADVLIGTQMLAKGMDLPKVTLAVVLAADGLLHRPDLFAEEQALQLFMQLAGRAGRGEKPGKVIVQTYSPEHPVILHLMDGSFEEFLEKEAKLRQETNLVPYSRTCLLRLSGQSASLTANSATILAEYIKPHCVAKGWMMLGPSPALVEKVAGKSRWQILLHGPEGSELPFPYETNLWECLSKGVILSIDPDPIQIG